MKWDTDKIHLIDAGIDEVEAATYTVFADPAAVTVDRSSWVKVGKLTIYKFWSRLDGCTTFNPKLVDVKGLMNRIVMGQTEEVNDAHNECIRAMCPDYCAHGQPPVMRLWRDKENVAYPGYFHGQLSCPAAPIHKMKGVTE